MYDASNVRSSNPPFRSKARQAAADGRRRVASAVEAPWPGVVELDGSCVMPARVWRTQAAASRACDLLGAHATLAVGAAQPELRARVFR